MRKKLRQSKNRKGRASKTKSRFNYGRNHFRRICKGEFEVPKFLIKNGKYHKQEASAVAKSVVIEVVKTKTIVPLQKAFPFKDPVIVR